nr:putative ribosomal n-acetyltransferase ydaf [Quercus suber]
MATASDVIVQLPDNLSIRRYRASDVAAMARHGTNVKVWNNLRNRFPHPYTEADAVDWMALIGSDAKLVLSGPWTAESGACGPALPTSYAIAFHDELIGSIGLEFGGDVYFRSAELGYWLGEEFWGRGVMSRVVEGFVPWVWSTFGVLVRLNVETNESNEGSKRVLGKAGFLIEGVRPNAVTKNGVTRGAIMWGLLRP